MFDDFLYNYYRSIKLDKNLYKDKKIFQNLSLYFAGLVVIIGGLAGLYAQNTFIKNLEANIPTTGFLTVVISSILGWILWTCLIYLIGGKLFSEANTRVNFKKLLIAVGYGHAPAIFRFFAVVPEILVPIVLITQIWIFLSIGIGINISGTTAKNLNIAGACP